MSEALSLSAISDFTQAPPSLTSMTIPERARRVLLLGCCLLCLPIAHSARALRTEQSVVPALEAARARQRCGRAGARRARALTAPSAARAAAASAGRPHARAAAAEPGKFLSLTHAAKSESIADSGECRKWVLLEHARMTFPSTADADAGLGQRKRYVSVGTARTGRPKGSSKRYVVVQGERQGNWSKVPAESAEDYLALGMQPMHCLSEEGCQKRANYGSAVHKLPLFCKPHSRAGDVDLRNRRCQAPDGCTKRPSFGNASEGKSARPLFCVTHKQAWHTDLVTSRCRETLCAKRASFALPADAGARSRPTYCAQHKKHGMVDVRHKSTERKPSKMLGGQRRGMTQREGGRQSTRRHQVATGTTGDWLQRGDGQAARTDCASSPRLDAVLVWQGHRDRPALGTLGNASTPVLMSSASATEAGKRRVRQVASALC